MGGEGGTAKRGVPKGSEPELRPDRRQRERMRGGRTRGSLGGLTEGPTRSSHTPLGYPAAVCQSPIKLGCPSKHSRNPENRPAPRGI